MQLSGRAQQLIAEYKAEARVNRNVRRAKPLPAPRPPKELAPRGPTDYAEEDRVLRRAVLVYLPKLGVTMPLALVPRALVHAGEPMWIMSPYITSRL